MTISSNSCLYPFIEPDNLDQAWLIPYALANVGIAVNIGDLCYDGTGGIALPAGQQASQGSEGADQILFAKGFIGCATGGCLAAETNPVRQLTIRTHGKKIFKCPSQSFNIGDLLGIYSTGSLSPDPTQLDAANLNPAGAIARVVPYPGNPTYYNAAVTAVCAEFFAPHAGAALGTPGVPEVQYVTGTTLTTFLVSELTGAKLCVYESTAVTPGSIATPTAALLYAASPLTEWTVRIINNSASANTMTITAGVGVTLSGTTTFTIAEFAYRDFLMSFTSPAALKMIAIAGGVAGN
jgi:hypothetical protein